MGFSDEKRNAVGAFLKDHLDLVLKNVGLAKLYCTSLEHKDAILILEQLLSEKGASLPKEELDKLRWTLAFHYEESGNSDKAISLYRLATNFQDKEALTTFLGIIRKMKGNPAAYREALRLLAENGETLATLYGIACECLFNDLGADRLRYLKKAVVIAPNDYEVCDDLAFVYHILGQEEESAYWYKKAALLAGA